MRYFIISNDTFKEVNGSLYKAWYQSEAVNFLFPEYDISILGISHLVQTIYYGETEYPELLMPFVIFYSEDSIMSLFNKKTKPNEHPHSQLFYFEDFKDYKKKYFELVHMVENKQAACFN